ncbi:kinesin-like protein KIF21A isoform X2 [Cimex lectularius]|uniref:Kinesin motor domain-containing protein n=1 Tax=Cimex lectularius TaxID=79782 RepID=A0A8I6TMI3_CIMLE|nr:kinesin-like protein KIF21A isoform X2 [Cimex lectularius]
MTDDESSVRVALRIRPQLPREVIDMCRVCTNVTPNEPQVTLGTDRSFTFDYVFDTQTNQASIYDVCAKSLIEGSLQGYNATILAYGQTGSGKTYTMGTGFDIDVTSEQIGIIPRAIKQLFDGISAATEAEKQTQFKVTCQFLELYNEEIIDLFDTSRDYSSNRGKSGIRIHEDTNHCIYLTGVTSQRVTSAEDTLQWLRQGALSRTTAATQMNTQSSRSHAIFSLHIKQQRLVNMESENGFEEGTEEFETLTAKFHFVDLAGSERLKRTGATGDRAKEGISINCGLLALGNVISALGDPSKRALHVPYRDSKLTRLLQDSLGGNSRTLMIACISPSDRDFMETLNTLIYANRARNIQNKVVINQDKSSRTISLLKKQIQELELELMEYKQGKRMITEDGVESVNDMFHENTMLQNEVDHLRTRVKAMQDTIDSLKAKNVNLMANQQVSASNADGDNKNDDMSQMIKGYLSEIESLQAKLVESESTCSQLRKAASRNKNLFLHSRMSISQADEALEDILELAKKDVIKDMEYLNEKKKDLSDQSESDSDSSSDSENEEFNKSSEYSAKYASLTSEMSVKQRLIEELEKTQSRLNNMKQHYEDKLNQLQAKIIATQQERDAVLSTYAKEEKPSEKVKKVKEEYERKLSDMQREVKSLQSAKREHAKLLRNQSQYESQVRTLKNEIAEMKKIKVKLMNSMKEEALKHKDAETGRMREIAQLKKQTRLDANLIKNLEAEKRAKAIVLKRKQEEVSALRRVANSHSRMRFGLKNKGLPKGASPKQAKNRWISIEKSIAESSMNRQSLMALEKEMEKKMESRVEIQEELNNKAALLSDPRFKNSSYIKEEVDSLRANLDHVQASIADLQNEILQVEENKIVFESGVLVQSLSDISEAAYILDKLYNMALHHSCLAVQKDVSLRELQAENEQLKKDSEMQEQLLHHLLNSKDRVRRSSGHTSPDSSKSSRSISPSENGSSTNLYKPNHPKYRSRKQLAPQDLLFLPDNENTGRINNQSHSAATSPEHRPQVTMAPPPLTRSLTTIKVQSVPASPVMMRKGLSMSPRVNRKTYIISSNHPSMERGLDRSPPNSPPAYRRQTSHEANVFSRLTSQPPNTTNRHPGKITANLNKRGLKTPLFNTHTVEGHSRAVLALNATDDNLFTASRDRTVLMWDLREMKEVHMFGGHPNNVVACKYDSNSHCLFTVSSCYVKIWDVRTPKCIKTLTSSGMVTSWSGGQLGNNEAPINDIALNEQGHALYTASGDRVRVWDIRKYSVIGKLIGGHQAAIMCLAVSPTSTGEDVVITGSKDHYIKVFDVGYETGGISNPRVTLEPPHYDGIQCLVMKGQTLFSGSRDCIIKKWELENHELVTSINSAHKDWVTGLCFAPGGSVLLSGSRDGTVKLWSADNCSQLAEIKAHSSPINAVAANSTHIFTAASKGEVKMWKECPIADQQQQQQQPPDIMTMSTGHIFQLSV